LADLSSLYSVRNNSILMDVVSSEIRWFIIDIFDAFQRRVVSEVEEDNGDLVNFADPKTSFSVMKLRTDLKRLLKAARPLLEVAAYIYDLLMWTNPFNTFILVIAYMYSIWAGYFVVPVFALPLLQLSLNYIKTTHNVDIGLHFLPRRKVQLPKLKVTSGRLLIDLASLAQWGVKIMADFLEKLESLFTWKCPDITFHFYLLCAYWLMWSLYFTVGTCFGTCGMALGIRIFFTTYLFQKFPRLRYRLDTFGYFYRNLPLKSGAIQPRPKCTDP
ncbi:hypothetical protein PMAYCL1PPCAC_20657, partial [Pristionchus mayeri]